MTHPLRGRCRKYALFRCRPREDAQLDPYQKGQLRLVQETFRSEVDALEKYLGTLRRLEEIPFASRQDRPHLNEQQWNAREHASKHVFQSRDPPQNPSAGPNFGPPRNPPVPAKLGRVGKAPYAAKPVPKRSAGPAVASKVNSNRPAPKVKKPNQDAEPWESWEGQDKDLASNLSNDIMDSSPGVKWDDIAGLHDAKRILQVSSTCNEFYVRMKSRRF